MTKPTRLVGDDSYEDLALAYQIVLVSMLDNALKESGIKLKQKRREICEKFLNAHGVFHDQYWLRSDGKTVYPVLGFSEVFQNVGMSPQQLGDITVNKEKLFSFEEYAWSILRDYFESNDTPPQVEVGLVGEESN